MYGGRTRRGEVSRVKTFPLSLHSVTSCRLTNFALIGTVARRATRANVPASRPRFAGRRRGAHDPGAGGALRWGFGAAMFAEPELAIRRGRSCMDIVVRGRNVEVPDHYRVHVEE